MDRDKNGQPAAAGKKELTVEAAYTKAMDNFYAGNYTEADKFCTAILQVLPNHIHATNLLGIIAQAINRLDLAALQFQKVIAIKPDHVEAHYNLGFVLAEQGKIADAIACYKEALALRPDYADALNNLGNIFKDQGKPDEAVASYQRAITVNPDHAQAHSNLGDVLSDLGRIDAAVASYQQAISIKADFAEAHHNLASALIFLGRADAAVASFRNALVVEPGFAKSHSGMLLAMHYSNFNQEDLFNSHRLWGDSYARQLPRFSHADRGAADLEKPLKIGFVSGDFREHSVAYFLQPLFAAHNGKKLVFYCYSNSKKEDVVTTRLAEMVAVWRNISSLDDQAVAEMVRSDGIDILVDLSGHTDGNRLLVFARKPAPVQVTWLGYPDTTGVSAIDYRFSDHVADPYGESDKKCVEQLYRLPDGFLCYRPMDGAPDVSVLPMKSNGYVTFVSFNNLSKISPEAIHAWSAILKATPGSKLMIKNHLLCSSTARHYFIDQFAKESINSQQLILLDRCDSKTDHLALYGQCDIALDTFPYNGVTTTCEALSMGVPVVVLRGDSHVARVGASLLTQVGLEELIANDLDDYINRAVSLAKDSFYLESLRKGMRSRMEKSTLYDGEKFASNIESAFYVMWSELCSESGA
ncbi:MAG: tetratricopeptide repeat protein [Magnetococcales bacterium]|nr:tetratricopeptide repeat protein [Magnetococcales bacterium]